MPTRYASRSAARHDEPMVKHQNTVPHDPPNSYGDCHRICFATILGVEPHEVPHFFEIPDADLGEGMINDYLRPFGLKCAHTLYPDTTPLPEILLSVSNLMQGVPFILGGRSRSGCGHSVVCLDGEIYNDPTGTGIIGPLESDIGAYYWITVFAALPNFARRMRK